MAVLKTRDVQQALHLKGFESFHGDHEYFSLHVNGKRTAIRTHISHGKTEIDDHLIGQMSKQTQLSKADFMDLIRCPLSKEAYIEKLIGQGTVI